ncbi:Hypothetical predicted protein [Prunus dulcis]|uniref:Pectinesterase inhibitor domain-containing protein n=1 Tax=Prunus dulcis TaxID=3755 RepID=A0A5E4E7I8_PRUDU|nr:Hypothetical predicted protein [Prunus dulcis]
MESSSSSTHFAPSFLTALSISFCIISSTSAARDLAPKTNTEFIKTSCSATTYPKLCLTSLSSHASTIQTSPKLMAGAALNVTLSSAKSTSAMMLKLSQSHGLKPKEVGAMRDCLEELSDSLMISDVQTWVSAALTDENTCSEGFGGNGMNGNLKTAVRGRIVNIAQLTSNALALINRYASVHG